MLELTILDAASQAAPPYEDEPSVEVWRDADGRICAYGNTSGAEHSMHLPGLASFRFTGRGPIVKAVAHPGARKDLIEDAYWRSVLPMALQVQGMEVLHASAFVADGAVIALCANSGTGKSTLAGGMGRRGYSLWADDAVTFYVSERGAWSIPLPFTLRLLPEAAKLFGDSPSPSARCDESYFTRKPSPLAALVLLNRSDAASGAAVECRPLGPNEAFVKVLAHAYCFSLSDAARKRLMIRNYLKLTTAVPAYELSFKEGLEYFPEILDCVERLAGAGLKD